MFGVDLRHFHRQYRSQPRNMEWSPATGDWTNRTLSGGSSQMCVPVRPWSFDSKRNKIILFGGARAADSTTQTPGRDPTSGNDDATSSGGRPSATQPARHGL